MFKGITKEAFDQYFRDEKDCLKYLAELKWGKGYVCRKCGCKRWWHGRKGYDRRCQQCSYNESPTSGTLFHKLKFSLLKAFGICFILSVRKKGMSSCELARAFGIRQQSAWYFKRKVHQAMKSSEKYPITGRIEVDEFVVGQKETGNQGRAKGERKIIIVCLEKVKRNKKMGRAYASCINGYGAEDFKAFFEGHIDIKAHVIADKWTGYSPLKNSYKRLEQVESGGGKNFSQLHTHIMRVKAWLRGVHHHCSERHIQGYLDEFHFRFNRRGFMDSILDKLLMRMVAAPPLFLALTLRELNE